MNPDYVKAYYRLGNAYEMNGEKNEAIKILKSGLAVAKKLNDADMISAIEKQIQSLQGAPTSAGSPGGLDLNSLLSNPMFGSMAQQMMSNPAMMESMLSGLGGSGGSAPNLDQLKNDPNLHVSLDVNIFPLISVLDRRYRKIQKLLLRLLILRQTDPVLL